MQLRTAACGIALALFASSAVAQVRPQVPQQAPATPDPVVTAFQLGFQTAQNVEHVLKEADDRLKWVLDNWVPGPKEPPK